jgi:hypothetical protein
MINEVSRAHSFFTSLPSDDQEAFLKLSSLVTNKSQDESEWLDYKSGKSEDNENDWSKSWGKALSGFANSGGGIVIWGIETKKENGFDVPAKIVPVQHARKFEDRLRTFVTSRIDPPVLEVQLRSIIQGNNAGFVVAYIPESKFKPHQAVNQHTYYLRVGDKHEPINTALLRQLFYPNKYPALRLRCHIVKEISTLGYLVSIYVKNKGLNSLEKLFAIIGYKGSNLIFEESSDCLLIDRIPSYANVEAKRLVHPGLECSLGKMVIPHNQTIAVTLFAKDIEALTWRLRLSDQNQGEIIVSGPNLIENQNETL